MKKRYRIKKQHKNIYLFLLVLLAVVLNNYNKYLNMENKNYEEDSLTYFVTSTYYGIEEGKEYAYVGNDSDETIKTRIASSSDIVIEDGKIKLYSWGTVLSEWIIVRVNLDNFRIRQKNILLATTISYNDFVSKIKTENTTYKIFNDNNEITSGNITNGATIKFYYKEDEIDSYTIVEEPYLNMNKLNVKDNEYIIKNISKVGELKKEIDTNGEITVYDKNEKVLKDTDYLTTASKVKVNLYTKNYEYKVVITGDVTGSGDIFIGDISKLYSYYENTIEMDKCYILAGDITNDGIIDMNDISKLYQYLKGTIDSL